MTKREYVFHMIVEQDEAVYNVAESPDRACYAKCKSYKEVGENMHEVIGQSLEDLKAKKKNPPKPLEIISVQCVEVTV